MGRKWLVWSVPARLRKRAESDRRKIRISIQPERRVTDERRTSTTIPEWANGWLCFESNIEKRRLMPIPADWERCSDHELEALRERAVVTSRA